MSIHAELSPEAKAQLAKENRNSTIASLAISTLVILLIFLVLGIFLLPNLLKETPTIVTYSANLQDETEQVQKKVNTQVQRKPSAPSSSTAPVIASTAVSAVSIPVPEVIVETETVEFGDGDGFGGGWGDGDGFGSGGGGASFFNQNVKADRIAYVIDYSGSMKGEKDKLMRDELTKSVKGLKPGTKYQMIFFSGPAWVAGSDASANLKTGEGLVKGDGGHKFEWTGKGAHDWKPIGKRQQVEWLDVTSNQMTESLRIIEKSKLVFGTDWTNPLEMAFDMEPPPQIIFFMTDGQMSGRDMMDLSRDLASKAKKKNIVVNSIAMMEPLAEESMLDLAKRTGGIFTIVEKGGKSREVKTVKKSRK